jgi:hypothetical protein
LRLPRKGRGVAAAGGIPATIAEQVLAALWRLLVYAPEADASARLLLGAETGSPIESAPSTTERKPGPSAGEFRFDPTVS